MTDSLSQTPTMTTVGGPRPRAWWLVYVPLIILFLFAVGPLLLAWFTAFKTDQQQLTNPYGLPLPPTLDNLREAWTVGRFSTYFKNSVIISIADVIGMVILSSLAGYAFARLHFPGQKLLLYTLLLGLTIPVAAIIIPLYLTMRDFRLLNTYGSVIVADIALAAPIFVFIMRAFFKDLPRELDDAARVDGANEFQIFWQIMLPLAKPGLMTVALLEFLWSWNDLLLPLVFLVSDELRTLPVGMLFFQGRFSIDYGLMTAGVLIISLPVTILFLIFQRDFVKGLASGALKG
ncbi:MAG: carbohydrate ABC transporter permease [Chloroflexi bacterium]|nr:carbohydrate ABC transporter permease [Chloroflexota bacterium]